MLPSWDTSSSSIESNLSSFRTLDSYVEFFTNDIFSSVFEEGVRDEDFGAASDELGPDCSFSNLLLEVFDNANLFSVSLSLTVFDKGVREEDLDVAEELKPEFAVLLRDTDFWDCLGVLEAVCKLVSLVCFAFERVGCAVISAVDALDACDPPLSDCFFDKVRVRGLEVHAFSVVFSGLLIRSCYSDSLKKSPKIFERTP